MIDLVHNVPLSGNSVDQCWGKKSGSVLAHGWVYLTVEIYETGKFYDYFLMLINERGEKEKQLHNGEQTRARIGSRSRPQRPSDCCLTLCRTSLPRARGTTSGSQWDETF